MGLLVLCSIAGTAIIFGASVRQNHGYAWADGVCSTASALCGSPGWLVLLTIALGLVYLYRVSF